MTDIARDQSSTKEYLLSSRLDWTLPPPDIDHGPIIVAPDTCLRDIVRLMCQTSTEVDFQAQKASSTSKQQISYVLVMADHKLLGIFTERDVVRLSAQKYNFDQTQIADVMSRRLITCPALELQDSFTVLTLFQKHGVSHLPILDNDAVVGVITPEGLRRSLQPSPLMKLRSVGEVMNPHMITASPEASVVEIAQLMTTHHISYVVIAQSSGSGLNPIGIISERDIVRFQMQGHDLSVLIAQSVMSTPLVCLSSKDAISEAHKTMERFHIRHLMVADPQDGLTGILTQAHIQAILNSSEMHSTVQRLQQQIHQLQTENNSLRQGLNTDSEYPVSTDVVTLRNYQERFRATFDQAAVGMAHVDLRGQFILTNQRFCNWLGYSQADVLQKSFIEITHPDDQQADQDKIQQLLSGNVSSFSREKRYLHQTGSILWGNVTVSLAVTPSGEPDYLIAVIEDIGERKRSETVLQQLNQELESRVSLNTSAFRSSERRYRLLFESAPDLLFMLNMQGEIRQVNTAVLKRLGYAKTKLIGRSLFQFLRVATEEICQQEFELLLQQGKYRQEMEFRCQDGTSLFVDCACSIITDTLDKVPYILVIQRDISDRVQAEAALKASEERYRSLYEKTPVMLHSVDQNDQLVSVSNTWLSQLGYQRSEVLGRPSTDFMTADSKHYAQSVVLPDYFRTGICQDVAYQFVKKNGEIIDVLLSAIAERDSKGEIARTLAVSVDVTERKRVEAALLESEQRFRLAFDEATIGMALIAPEGRWLRVNQAICDILGYGEAELLRIDFQSITHPDDLRIDLDYIQQMLTGKIKTYQLEKRYFHQQGHVVWVLLSVSLVRDDQGKPLYFISQIQDISDRKRTERDLFQEKELAQVTLESIGDAVITTDIYGTITKFNPVAEHLTGWTTDEAQGQSLSEVFNIIHEKTRDPAEEPVQRALREGRIVGLANHTVLISRDGTEYAIEDSAAPIRDRQGQVIGAVMVFHDVTYSRNLTHQLSWQASHDPLTRLANRRKFDQVLFDTLQETRQTHYQHVLCFLDLDQFKVINDTCGHAAGDELLCQVAKLLQYPIRSADTLARLGGDEFGILLYQCPMDRAKIIADRLRQSIQEYRFHREGKTFRIGVSIGLVQLSSKNTDIEEILGAADMACYAAKAKGRNRIQVYESNDTELIHQRGEQLWSVRIKQAIEDNRLCLYGQSIVPTSNRTDTKPSSCEILLRMIDEQGELVAAAAFIPAAERYNLMSDIDRWVVREFLSRYSSYRSIFGRVQGSRYMINLSGFSVGDEPFLCFLKDQFEAYPGAAQHICFEITETAAISNLNQAGCFIQELKQLGCQFALDDFGSGMSSFAYLKTLPVDYLKIDGRFIEDMADDPTTCAIVESINHIGHVMGMQTIAEFVSTVSIREKLQEIGVDYVQGFEISQPKALS